MVEVRQWLRKKYLEKKDGYPTRLGLKQDSFGIFETEDEHKDLLLVSESGFGATGSINLRV